MFQKETSLIHFLLPASYHFNHELQDFWPNYGTVSLFLISHFSTLLPLLDCSTFVANILEQIPTSATPCIRVQRAQSDEQRYVIISVIQNQKCFNDQKLANIPTENIKCYVHILYGNIMQQTFIVQREGTQK